MEHAKSSRSKCRKCLQPVQEGELRLAYEREPDEKPWFPAPVPHWFHTKCFLQDLEHVLQDREGIPLAGINTEWFDGEAEPEVLEKLDKDFDNLRAKHGLPKLAEAKSKAAKGKREGKSEQIDGGASAPASKRGKSQKKEQAEEQQQRSSATGKKDSSRDAALKRQSEELQDLHKKLGNCTLDELRSMLDANGINPRGKGETLVNRAAEGMLFGVLENCKRCGENAWDYEQDGYHCNGNVSGWEPCGVITQSPPVKEWKVPDDVKTIKQKKFKPKKRVFPLPEGATREMSAVSEGAGEKNTRRKDDDDDEDDSGGRKRASKSKSKKGSKAWTPESTKATTRSSTRSAPPTRSSSPGNSGRKRAAGGHVRAAFVDTLAVAIQRKLPDADLMSVRRVSFFDCDKNIYTRRVGRRDVCDLHLQTHIRLLFFSNRHCVSRVPCQAMPFSAPLVK